jgi:tetratricopeptide (TPR) repeat protein
MALALGDPDMLGLAASSAATLGRLDEALRLDRRAVDLDPLAANSWSSLGQTEFLLGRFDEAAADVRKSLELSPDVWPDPNLLGEIYIAQGRPQDVLREVELVRYDGFRAYLYAIAYYALGRKKESDDALSQLIAKHVGNEYLIACVYALGKSSTRSNRLI